MPANLSPDYKKAEQAYRAATEDRERLSCLKEMLRTIPKHKGTEHLQADIKTRIKALSDELAGPKKGGTRTGPVHSIRPEGAAQIALVGPANSGKSSLHVVLTGSRANVGPYPLTTQEPMAGMCPYEDVWLQLVDLPPLSPDFVPPWIGASLQPADGVLLVVDIADPETPEQIEFVMQTLDSKRVTLIPDWPADDPRSAIEPGEQHDDAALDPFRIYLPALLVANKSDLGDAAADLAVLQELTSLDLPAVAVSAEGSGAHATLAPWLFQKLGIVRVYTKTPGKPAEMDKPFTVRRGASVLDVARLVHKDIARSLRYARAWGTNVYDGQQVGPEHPVADRDVLELHMR